MKYQVEITDPAWFELQEAYDWLAERAPTAALRWRAGLLAAIETLESSPQRCGVAPESEHLDREIRQLLYGKRNNKYRILFEIRAKTVVVLRVRHGARRTLGE
jgi:plasmid stabilization system protein ParE